MQTIEQILCEQIRHQPTFSNLCRKLANAHRESKHTNTPLHLHETTQAMLFQQLTHVLPGILNKNTHPTAQLG